MSTPTPRVHARVLDPRPAAAEQSVLRYPIRAYQTDNASTQTRSPPARPGRPAPVRRPARRFSGAAPLSLLTERHAISGRVRWILVRLLARVWFMGTRRV